MWPASVFVEEQSSYYVLHFMFTDVTPGATFVLVSGVTATPEPAAGLTSPRGGTRRIGRKLKTGSTPEVGSEAMGLVLRS